MMLLCVLVVPDHFADRFALFLLLTLLFGVPLELGAVQAQDSS